MPRLQDGSSVVDQIIRLKLKLLEKRLENKKRNMDARPESVQSASDALGKYTGNELDLHRALAGDLEAGSYNGQMEALHRALRRKQDLLQRLREEHLLEHFNRPHTWGGSQRRYQTHYVTAPQPHPQIPTIAANPIHHPAPVLPYLLSAPPAMPQPPRIIQQTLPQQPATIIQQLPQQQPLITQIAPPQPYPAGRSGSIKEDMVELMLMQNAQMHQIIMHNMMLKALPPLAPSPPGGNSHSASHALGQGSFHANPIFERSDFQPSGGAVYHHHHYGPAAAAPHLPPISYNTWLPGLSPIPAGQAGGQVPSLETITAPTKLPPLNVTQIPL